MSQKTILSFFKAKNAISTAKPAAATTVEAVKDGVTEKEQDTNSEFCPQQFLEGTGRTVDYEDENNSSPIKLNFKRRREILVSSDEEKDVEIKLPADEKSPNNENGIARKLDLDNAISKPRKRSKNVIESDEENSPVSENKQPEDVKKPKKSPKNSEKAKDGKKSESNGTDAESKPPKNVKKAKKSPKNKEKVEISPKDYENSDDNATEDDTKQPEDVKKPKKSRKNIKKAKISPKNVKKSNETSPEIKNKPEDKKGKKSPKNEEKAEISPKDDKNSDDSDPDDIKKPKKSPKIKEKTAEISCKDVKKSDDNSYNPSKSKYHPINDAVWDRGTKVPYLALARTLDEIENTSSRLRMIEIMSNFFRSVIVLSPDDLLPALYLCLNRVAPEYAGLELGVGDSLLYKAVAQATGRTVEKLKNDVAAKGDLGLVAESCRSNQRTMFPSPKLTLSNVFQRLKEIAQMTGNSVFHKKTDKIQSMFVACRHSEARFLVRSLTGKLRVGLAEQSVLQALAMATFLTPPGQSYPPEIIDASKGLSTDTLKKKINEEALIIKTTYCECPNYDLIVPVILNQGVAALPENCCLKPGIPLKPMLAHPTKEVIEVLRRFDNAKFTCEYKYDGERAQIHLTEDKTVNVFSRNQEDNTSKYPDIIARIPNAVNEGVTSFILDTEAVAWDVNKKQILPFQILSTRKRKNADASEIKVQVCIFAFDMLYLNGESMVKMPLSERRRKMKESFKEIEDEFVFAKAMDGNTLEDIEEFLEESIKGKCEGLMVKTLDVDATYEIAKRSRNWLKLKKDYLDGVGDTLDLVVIGGYRGKGKRTGTYGGFLLACYDPENEEFQTICKIGTGFKEEDLETHTKFLKDHIIDKPKMYFRYDGAMEPDDWFDAVQVWEVKCADLSISPVYKAGAGIVDPEKGISLRFPRFLRIRDDKKPEDATNSSMVADMFKNQIQMQTQQEENTSKFADDDEDIL